jgi:hypothetical protein
MRADVRSRIGRNNLVRVSARNEREVTLVGGMSTPGVVRVGDTVRRPVKPDAAYVHGLLRHFERHGFEGAPRFLGFDEQAGRASPTSTASRRRTTAFC